MERGISSCYCSPHVDLPIFGRIEEVVQLLQQQITIPPWKVGSELLVKSEPNKSPRNLGPNSGII